MLKIKNMEKKLTPVGQRAPGNQWGSDGRQMYVNDVAERNGHYPSMRCKLDVCSAVGTQSHIPVHAFQRSTRPPHQSPQRQTWLLHGMEMTLESFLHHTWQNNKENTFTGSTLLVALEILFLVLQDMSFQTLYFNLTHCKICWRSNIATCMWGFSHALWVYFDFDQVERVFCSKTKDGETWLLTLHGFSSEQDKLTRLWRQNLTHICSESRTSHVWTSQTF